MPIRSILAITALAFGINAGMANAEPRESSDDRTRKQRQEQPRHVHAQPPNSASHDGKQLSHHAEPQSPMDGKPPTATRPTSAADRGRGAGPERQLHKGDHLPAKHRGRHDVIGDWHGHHLSAPPRGQHWVQTGADYVLVAVATGVITQIVFGN